MSLDALAGSTLQPAMRLRQKLRMSSNHMVSSQGIACDSADDGQTMAGRPSCGGLLFYITAG